MWKLVFNFALLIATSEAVAQRTEFLLINERLNLVSDSRSQLELECQHLNRYVRFFHRRNNLSIVAQLTCKAEKLENLRSLLVDVPDFTSSRNNRKVLGEISQTTDLFHVDVEDRFPKDIRRRLQPRSFDGVCYNSSLTDSGILPTSFRSHVILDNDYWLGMKTFGQSVSNSPLVSQRFTIQFTPEDADAKKKELDQLISTQFSPGSVMCFYTHPAQVIAGQTIESQGSHCFVFITPSLVSESNLYQPHALVSWNRLFQELTKGASTATAEKIGTFHYFKLNQTEVESGNWVRTELTRDPRTLQLYRLATQHQRLFDQISEAVCARTDSLDDCRRKISASVDYQTFRSKVYIRTLQGSQFRDWVRTAQSYELLTQAPRTPGFNILRMMVFDLNLQNYKFE